MKMTIITNDFLVPEGSDVKLRKWSTKIEPVYQSKKQYQKILGEHVAQLSTQQQLLYASTVTPSF